MILVLIACQIDVNLIKFVYTLPHPALSSVTPDRSACQLWWNEDTDCPSSPHLLCTNCDGSPHVNAASHEPKPQACTNKIYGATHVPSPTGPELLEARIAGCILLGKEHFSQSPLFLAYSFRVWNTWHEVLLAVCSHREQTSPQINAGSHTNAKTFAVKSGFQLVNCKHVNGAHRPYLQMHVTRSMKNSMY